MLILNYNITLTTNHWSGKGLAERSRAYVKPIAMRYVTTHQQHLFDIQAMRRSPNAVNVGASLQIPDITPPTNDMFNDDDWNLELKDVEVQEADGTWRNVTLFRHKVNTNHVCIWFGNLEYEGIDPSQPYTFNPRTESLEDDEGFSINWRFVSADSDSSSDDDDDDNDYDM